jgi:NAD-dependent dihydropyrimidine dehydrogenase PreA subunit
MLNIELNYEKCINCKTCVSICPMGVYKDEGEKVTIIAEQDCIICRGCEAACPTDAIRITE